MENRSLKTKMNNESKMKQWAETYGSFVCGVGFFIALCSWLFFEFDKERKVNKKVNKQVEAYEKTLPAEYVEYKQAVEHYRDSLMRTKGR